MAILFFILALVSFILSLTTEKPLIFNLFGYISMIAGYYELYF